jgi:hypothetical protein
VAAAVERHIQDLKSDGHGDFVVNKLDHGFSLDFGTVNVTAENYDIALMRLAGALLDDVKLGGHFLARLQSGNLLHLIREQQ